MCLIFKCILSLLNTTDILHSDKGNIYLLSTPTYKLALLNLIKINFNNVKNLPFLIKTHF